MASRLCHFLVLYISWQQLPEPRFFLHLNHQGSTDEESLVHKLNQRVRTNAKHSSGQIKTIMNEVNVLNIICPRFFLWLLSFVSKESKIINIKHQLRFTELILLQSKHYAYCERHSSAKRNSIQFYKV